ncbi:putative F-box protein At5g62660 [Daucus carota subsp. sativus]|uniref:putative F-box protein At5g62660 n=2 Tax=Daucus carota subsp. sativus TaxID=79200 RepID=UPI0007F0397F|nr:PREDICTED: putative F-box protein At5g62660 [Daucus carota subsp. sativus]XP_017236464.1 PREDICTED: putative F-box protein At5g62660 [Daucus carota subsp. sativus]
MTTLSDLPDHLLLCQIFTRLPVKFLIVLTSVCKSWLALISSRFFVEAHLSRFHMNPDNHQLLLHHPFSRNIIISPVNFFGNPHSSMIPIPATEDLIDTSGSGISRNLWSSSQDFLNSMHTFVGSVNGLVCSSRPPLRPTNVTIWNPATHRCKNISVPRIDIKYVWSILVGFGFNFVVNDYKIVCIYELGLELQNPSYRFRLYSCKDNSWKELKPNFPLQLIFVECVVVKANPYWMCLCNQRRNEFWVKVDVKTEEIQMFKGPEYVKKDTTSSSNMALGDFVAQAVCSPGAQANDMIHIYTLEENAGVWMRMYSFGLPGVQRPVRLKCFKNGKIVFTNGNQNKLYMYDLTSGKVKTLMVAQGRDMIHMPMNYTESLVSIEGMVSVGEGAVKEERQEAAPLAATNRNASNAMMSDNMD